MAGITQEDVTSALGSAAETIDGPIIDYITGILSDSSSANADELYETLSSFLPEDLSEKEGLEICSRLAKLLISEKTSNVSTPQKETFKKLDAPIKIDEQAKKVEQQVKDSLSWMDSDKVIYVYNGDTAPSSAQRKIKKQPVKPVPKKVVENTIEQFVLKRESFAGASKDLRLQNFDVQIAGKTLIKDADLHLLTGRRYGLVGRNGYGKSTLLRFISTGELPVPPHIQILHVEQEVVGDDTLAIDSVLQADVEREFLITEEKRLLSVTPATPKVNEDLLKVHARMSEIEADKAEPRAAKILAGLGFTQEMQRSTTKTFSGGWRMRIALARALYCQPDLLLLDEPTNMLDIKAVIWLSEYLKRWKNTLLIVSHDRDFLNEVVTDIIHLEHQKLVAYKGDYDTFQKARSERNRNQQKQHEAQVAHRAHIQKFIDRFRFNAKRASLVQSRLKMLNKMEVVSAVVEDPTITFKFPEPDDLKPPIIQFNDVSFGYKKDKILFPLLNFAIDMESRISLVGSNGQGKSTLLGLLSGELTETSGYIFRNGRLRIAKFSQHHVDQLDLDITPLEYLSNEFPGLDQQLYRSQLGAYGISGPLALQKIETLSGGQKSRVTFAYLGMRKPHLLILDEPTNHLDIETVDVLAMALNNFTGGIVLVSHDKRLIQLVCNELWVVENGRVTIHEGDFDSYKLKILKELN
eukprot:TRINITY_DN539_c0_g5_i1.p1 TRINITY_DN539_c0_g5~~TRINITY_DN539_c0_g5_i1.p1  ORF type:complete len:693 (+),score=142.55 TRINITY_DN539_c0_g5_i1:38-2116(+)